MMAAPTYIISRAGDPLFALFIGLSAAAVRIRREERAQGRDLDQTLDAVLRYEDGHGPVPTPPLQHVR